MSTYTSSKSGWFRVCKTHFRKSLISLKKNDAFVGYSTAKSGKCDFRSGPRNGKCCQPAYRELFWQEKATEFFTKLDKSLKCKHDWKPYNGKDLLFKRGTVKKCSKCKMSTGEL